MTSGSPIPPPEADATAPGEQTRELREGLDALGIPWEDASDAPGGDGVRIERTRIMRGEAVAASCVIGPGTWGYPRRLECRTPSPEGPLDRPMTAREVLDGARGALYDTKQASAPRPRRRG